MTLNTTHYSTSRGAFLALAIAIFIAGSVDAQRRRGRAQQQDYTEVDPSTAATIAGKVTLKGEAPPERPIRMDADPVCAASHDETVFTNRVKVNDKGELKDVFVYISKGLEGMNFPPPEEAGVLDQQGCMYHPTVWGAQVGQDFIIRNSDPTLHNVHAMSADDADLFNLAMPTKGLEIRQEFREPSVMVKVKCDVHPWMFSYGGVLDHPYYALTDESGNFKITNLPPGTYTLSAWQRGAGFKAVEFTVGASETVEANFEYSFQ